MAKLQSDGYEKGYFHNIYGRKTIAWTKIMHRYV